MTSTDGPELLKKANVSSHRTRRGPWTNPQPASPPGWPSKSERAETLITSGKAAGTKSPASRRRCRRRRRGDRPMLGRGRSRRAARRSRSAPGAVLAPAHARDVDVVGRVAVRVEGRRAVERAERQRLRRVPGVVEHLDRDERRLRRDADTPTPLSGAAAVPATCVPCPWPSSGGRGRG